MTLKTSLIITGDASVARKEVADLVGQVAALTADARTAAAAIGQLDAAQTDMAASTRQGAAAVGDLDTAQRDGAASARELTQAVEAVKPAQAGVATAADEAAKAQVAYGEAIARIADESARLTAANDNLQKTIDGVKDQLTQIGEAQTTAATGADAHSAAVQSLQGEIASIVASVTSGSSVFEAMAAHGNDIAVALEQVAQASGGAKTGLDAAGGSGAKAGVDLGGLGDTVLDTAGKVEGMGGKLASAAAILGGPWGAAIGIAINLLGGFVAGLIEGAAEADDLAASSLSLADALSHQGTLTDAARKALEDYNKQSDQTRQRMVIEEQLALRNANAWLAKATATRAATKALLDQRNAEASKAFQLGNGADGIIVGVGETGRVAASRATLSQNDQDVGLAQQARRNLLIEQGKRDAAAATDPLVAIGQKYDLLAEKAEKAAKGNDKLAASLGKTLSGIERNRNAELAAAQPVHAPRVATGGGGATRSRAAARDPAADAAADAQRQLARDLEQVTSRYLPAAAAAKDYADELARIDKLAKAYDPKAADSGLSPEQATAARAALKAANDKRVAEINLTPEAKAADDAKKSIDGVIAALTQELAVRQTLDPVQRAMIGHQAELAKMSDTERAAYEAKLRALYAQDDAYKAIEAATRAAADAQRYFRDMALDAFDAVVLGGEKAGKVIDRLAKTIASAAIEAAVLGTGPLAALLKGGGTAAAGTAAPVAAAASAGAAQATADLLGKTVSKSLGDRLDSVFGKGNGGKALQNAGFGYTAASIAGGSGVGGALGGTVGGELAGKFLSKTLGSLSGLAGPLGSIAGGILGGVLGGLFKKASPSGAVSITGGETSSYSGSGKYADALGGNASTVQGQIAEIAKQLGGAVGAFGVAIGKNGDWYHVSGDPNADVAAKHPKSPLIYEGKDEAAALAAALANAVADGAVTGLSARVSKAIQSSADVTKALAEAVKVQDLELLVGGVNAQIDKAFRDFDTQAKERVRLATTYGFDLVAIEKRNGEDRVKLAEQLTKQQVGSLQKLIDEITQGSLFEGDALDKITALNTAIAKAKVDLDEGVDGASDTLADLYQKRLAASKEAYGTTSGYAADRTATLDEARAAVAAANARIVAAQAKTTSDPALATTNATLDEIADQNARAVTAAEQSAALLSAIVARGSSGSSFDLGSLAAF